MNKLIELSYRRLGLYDHHIDSCISKNKPIFTNDFFEKEFTPLIADYLDEIGEIFIDMLRGYDNISLLEKGDIEIQLDLESDESFLIEIVPKEKGAVIYIGLRLFFYIDLFNQSQFKMLNFRGDKSMFSIRDPADTTAILADINKTLNIPQSFSSFMIENLFFTSNRFKDCEIITNQNKNILNSQILRRWCSNSAYSMYWILCHEYSHFIMGHTSFFNELHVTPKESWAYSKEYYIENHLKEAELLADSYATNRLLRAILVTQDNINNATEDKLFQALSYHGLQSVLLSILLISCVSDNYDENLTHPHSLTRMFGAFSTFLLFVTPYDEIQKTLVPEKYSYNTLELDKFDKAFYFINYNVKNTLYLMIENNALINNKMSLDEIEEFCFYFDILLIASLNGFTDQHIIYFITKNWSLKDKERIKDWFRYMELYCTNHVAVFINHIKREFFERIEKHKEPTLGYNQIIDPTYLELDNWMTLIQSKTQHMFKAWNINNYETPEEFEDAYVEHLSDGFDRVLKFKKIIDTHLYRMKQQLGAK